MVYKIGNIKDLNALPPMDENIKTILYRYAQVLSKQYDEGRDTDCDDGGYILYVTPHTSCEDIKAYFDYSKYTAECVEQYEDICSAMYLLNNEYVVTIVARTKDMPIDIVNEIDEG